MFDGRKYRLSRGLHRDLGGRTGVVQEGWADHSRLTVSQRATRCSVCPTIVWGACLVWPCDTHVGLDSFAGSAEPGLSLGRIRNGIGVAIGLVCVWRAPSSDVLDRNDADCGRVAGNSVFKSKHLTHLISV